MRRQAPRRPAPGASGGGGASDGRNRLILYGAAGAGLVGLVVALVVVFAAGGGGGGKSGLEQKLAAAGCTLASSKATSRDHVTDINAKIRHRSFPPTSGKHYAQPAPWNFYPDPIVQIQGVHNLEHGGIVIQYDPKVPAAQVQELRDFYDSDSNAMLVAPFSAEEVAQHPEVRRKFALAAWTAPDGGMGEGHLALCGRFDESAFEAFRDAYRGKGPERFPVSSLTRGS